MLNLKSTLTKTFILLIIMNLFSCISLKDVQLIQPDPNLKLDANGKISFEKPEYHIQKNGNGVYVRQDGAIELPRIGKIKLEGLTIEQARKKIQDEFYKIYDEKGTFIDVNLAGIEYTIVGEASQGVFRAPKKNITLLDAFAQSGTNNIYADLKNVCRFNKRIYYEF